MKKTFKWNYCLKDLRDLLIINGYITFIYGGKISAITNEGYPRHHIVIKRMKTERFSLDVHQDFEEHKAITDDKDSKKLLKEVIALIGHAKKIKGKVWKVAIKEE